MAFPTFTFYSYKGGSCRSVTTFNVLPFLVEAMGASAKAPILVLDMDLDSAGITALFEEDVYFRNNYDVKMLLREGFPDTNEEVEDLQSHEFFKHLVPVGSKIGVEDGSVMLLGANDSMVFGNEEIFGGDKSDAIKTLKQALNSNHFKALVLDSASGDQFPAQIATSAATTIVCCMRPTRQFRTYTFQYLRRLQTRISDGTKVLLLPTAVPNLDVDKKNSTEIENALKVISDRIHLFNNEEKDCLIEEFVHLDCFGIPEVEQFKWREDVLYQIKQKAPEKLTHNEKLALSRYQKVAEKLESLA